METFGNFANLFSLKKLFKTKRGLTSSAKTEIFSIIILKILQNH